MAHNLESFVQTIPESLGHNIKLSPSQEKVTERNRLAPSVGIQRRIWRRHILWGSNSVTPKHETDDTKQEDRYQRGTTNARKLANAVEYGFV